MGCMQSLGGSAGDVPLFSSLTQGVSSCLTPTEFPQVHPLTGDPTAEREDRKSTEKSEVQSCSETHFPY